MAKNIRIIIGKSRIYFVDINSRGHIRYYYATAFKLRPIAKKKAVRGIRLIETRKEKAPEVLRKVAHQVIIEDEEKKVEKRAKWFIGKFSGGDIVALGTFPSSWNNDRILMVGASNSRWYGSKFESIWVAYSSNEADYIYPYP